MPPWRKRRWTSRTIAAYTPYLKRPRRQLNRLQIVGRLGVGGQLNNERLLRRGLLLHQVVLLTIAANLDELQLLALLVLKRVLRGRDDELLLAAAVRLIIRIPKTSYSFSR